MSIDLDHKLSVLPQQRKFLMLWPSAATVIV